MAALTFNEFDDSASQKASSALTFDEFDGDKKETYVNPNQALANYIQKDSRWGMAPLDLGIGFLRGASNVFGSIPQGMKAGIESMVAGEGQSGARRRYEEEKQRLASTYSGMTDDSVASKVGTFGGEVAGTMGAGNVLAGTVRSVAPSLTNFARSLEAGGFGKDIPYLTRLAGGAISGGASTAMIDPKDAKTGATLGAVLPGVIKPVGYGAANLAGKVADYFGEGLARIRGGKLLREIAGPDEAAISQAWQTASPDLTAAQAAVGVGRQEMSALGELARRHDPSSYARITRAQDAADLAALESAAGAKSTTEAMTAAQEGRKAVEASLGPEREFLLDVANVGAEAPRMTAQAEVMRKKAAEFRATPDPAKHQQAAALIRQATRLEGMASDIERAGFVPLDVSNVSNKIHQMLDDPALGSSENVASVLNDVNRQIEHWVGKGEGAIDARALYAKRKTAVNETVDKLLAGASPAASKRLSAKLADEVKSAIDESLNAVTGDKWSGFLSKYSDQLKELDRAELVNVAREMYASGNTKGFMELMKGESPETVRKIMTTDFDIAKALPTVGLSGPNNTFSSMQKVAKNLERNARVEEDAISALEAAGKLSENQKTKIKIPGMLSRTATVGNALLAVLESRLNAETMKVVTEAMKSGKSANELMKLLPAHERNAALAWVANGGPASYVARTTGAIAGNPDK